MYVWAPPGPVELPCFLQTQQAVFALFRFGFFDAVKWYLVCAFILQLLKCLYRAFSVFYALFLVSKKLLLST